MKNTISIEHLIQALEDTQKAKTAYEDAREIYNSQEWKSYEYFFTQEVENRVKKFSNILNEFIENKIHQALVKNKLLTEKTYD